MILTAPAQSVVGRVTLRGWRRPGQLPWGITPNRVLVLTGQRLLIASSPYVPESPEEERTSRPEYASELAEVRALPEVCEIPLRQVLWLEAGTILLISWLELAWVHQGEIERIRIDFNTVGRDLFADLAARIRLAILAAEGVSLSGNAHGLERLEALPFKFRRAIPDHVLLRDEQVLGALFRPSQWATYLAIFRRHVTPRLAVLRTDAHLIVAGEHLTSVEDSYGLIAQFCPLPRVKNVTLEERDGRPELRIAVGLDGVEDVLRVRFSVGTVVELESIAAQGGVCMPTPAGDPAPA